MEPIEYVAPGGARQTVASPQVAERLRAAGWRPYTELAALAGKDETAREHVERAQRYAEQRQKEQEEREARFTAVPSAEPADPAESVPADDGEQPTPAAAGKRRATRS